MLPKYKKYNSLQRKEKFLFLEALVLHLWVGLLLKVIPFRWIPRLFSSSKSTLNRKSQIANRKSQVSELEQIKIAIQRTSPYSPWRNKCLVSSLAARRMLNRRKVQSQLSLGLAKGSDGRMIAHAWIKAGAVEIVEKGRDFRELYLF